MTNITNLKSNHAESLEAGQQILAQHTTWHIDRDASRIEFSVRKRLMFVKKLTVTGRFADATGSIVLDDQDPTNARAEIRIGARSIDTKNARRDKHLRTADFFDVERYPDITFVSRDIETIDSASRHYRVTGDLTVRDVTRQVLLDTRFTPATPGAAQPRLKLTLTGTVNRRDFGIVWNKAAIDVADEIQLALQVEAIPG